MNEKSCKGVAEKECKSENIEISLTCYLLSRKKTRGGIRNFFEEK
jgi:hypothetical protein